MLLVLHLEMPSPRRTKILSGFLRATLAPFGVKYGDRIWRHLGANFGDFGAELKAIYGIILDHVASASSKMTQRYTSETSPGHEGETEWNQKLPQNTKTPPKR